MERPNSSRARACALVAIFACAAGFFDVDFPSQALLQGLHQIDHRGAFSHRLALQFFTGAFSLHQFQHSLLIIVVITLGMKRSGQAFHQLFR